MTRVVTKTITYICKLNVVGKHVHSIQISGKIKHACAYLGLQKHDWYLKYKKYKLLKLPIWWGLLYMTYIHVMWYSCYVIN